MTLSTNPVTVVNIRKDTYDIYAGRPGKGIVDAPFGNPHPIDELCPICNIKHKKGEAVIAFREWFYSDAGQSMRDLVQLRIHPGDRLGCFCVPFKRCHAEVIAEYVNNGYEQPPAEISIIRNPWE